MQAIMETTFDVVYLVTVITLGILMIRRPKAAPQFRLLDGWLLCWGPAMPFTWFLAPLPFALPAWKTTLLPSVSVRQSLR